VPHDVIVSDVVEALWRWLAGETKTAAPKRRGKVQ
jgi:hypothetical protein